jgi:hypothetical protein
MSAPSTEASTGAVEAALLAVSTGARPNLAPPRVLPRGALDLIRVAAGDHTHAAWLAERHGVDVRRIEDAALHFVHTVMFHPESDHFRVLGVRPDDDEETLKLHFRWLQKWLHPDRDPEGWVSAYAERVNVAWAQLRRADRRAAYRAELEARDRGRTVREPIVVGVRSMPAAFGEAVWPRRSIPARWIRRLPALLVGAVAASALGLYAAHRAGESLLMAAQESRHLADLEDPPAVVVPDERVTPRAESGASISIGQVFEDAQATPAAPTREPMAVAARPDTTMPRPEPSAGRFRSSDSAASAAEQAATPLPSTPTTKPRESPRSSGTMAATGEHGSPSGLPTKLGQRVRVGPHPGPGVAGGSMALTHAVAMTADPSPGSPASDRAGPDPAELSPEGSRALLPQVASDSDPPASAQEGARIARAVDPETGRRILSQLSSAYREGRVQEVVVLFAPNARTPEGNLIDLHQRYGLLFASSARRSLEFRDVEWRPLPNGLEGVGRYEHALRSRTSRRTEASAGRMRVVIELVEGRPLIVRLDQDDVG